MNSKIYVQIASYRDPELEKTVLDLVEKADHPENLRICIGWQHGLEENILSLLKKVKNLRIIDQHFSKSTGVCAMRHRLQKEWRGEEYSLCLDSHHRFVEGWDSICIDMYENLKKKGYDPILTSYLPSYDPEDDPKARVMEPWRLKFDRFIPEGCIFFLPETIPGFRNLKEPVRSRFFSGHFSFTRGSWNIEILYDPNFYFHGEEISLAVRSFTHGFDLFHPHRLIAWHEYTRKGRTKQWDDDTKWMERNDASHARNRELLEMDKRTIAFGKFGLGQKRSLRDYEIYAGIHFQKRGVQNCVLEGAYPPALFPDSMSSWQDSFLTPFRHCLDVYKTQLKEEDYDFWVFTYVKDKKEIERQDVSKAEIEELIAQEKKDGGGFYKLWREVDVKNGRRPDTAMIWPHSKSKGWMEKIILGIKS
jgi:hypothetical protein